MATPRQCSDLQWSLAPSDPSIPILGRRHPLVNAAANWYSEPMPGRAPSYRKVPREEVSRELVETVLRQWYEKGLRPGWPKTVKPVLRCAVRHLENIHLTWQAWHRHEPNMQANYDTAGIRKSIESHESDPYRGPVNLLIDMVRDALKCLAEHSPEALLPSCNSLVKTEVPLLQRLAIHGLSHSEELDANAKIQWLRQHVSPHDRNTHPELYKVVCKVYVHTNLKERKRFLQFLRSIPHESSKKSDDLYGERHYRKWLKGLLKEVPDCPVLQQEISVEQQASPDWELTSHPQNYDGLPKPKVTRIRSPLTKEELLTKPTAEWLPDLLTAGTESYQEEAIRSALQLSVAGAVQQCLAWGWDLAEALVLKEIWETDLWSGLLIGWTKTEMNVAGYGKALKYTSLVWTGRTATDQVWLLEVTWLLEVLAKQAQLHPCILPLLPDANSLAKQIWDSLDRTEPKDEFVPWNLRKMGPGDRESSWLDQSINHPAGMLCHFWVEEIRACSRRADALHLANDADIRRRLECVLSDPSWLGRMGILVLTSRLEELMSLDPEWTQTHVLPLLRKSDNSKSRAGWVGLLKEFKPLVPSTACQLRTAFLNALPRIGKELNGDQKLNFMAYFLEMFHLFPDEVLNEWIPDLFLTGDAEMRHFLSRAISEGLQSWSAQRIKQTWNQWLHHYWKSRVLYNVPPPALDAREVWFCLTWLEHLSFAFQEAVDLAIQMPLHKVQSLWTALMPLVSSNPCPRIAASPAVSCCHGEASAGD